MSKSSDRTFYWADDVVVYTLLVTCEATKPLGSVFASKIEVRDKLPTGLTFVDATPSPTTQEADGTLVWVYDGQDAVPEQCGGTSPAAAADTIQVRARVEGPIGDGGVFASNQAVNNTVDAAAEPLGGGTPTTRSATRTIRVLADGDEPSPGAARVEKTSRGPLNISDDETPDYRGTHPGRWLPNGVAVNAPYTDLIMTKPATLGVWENELRVFYDHPALDARCAGDWGEYHANDPDGLRPTGATSTASCRATAQVQRAAAVTGLFSLTKSVQGDLDDRPFTHPDIGHASVDDGSADWTISWQSTGAPDLEQVVLYDVLPHEGDTGVMETDVVRGSQFRPLLAEIGPLPDGVSVEYSASANPCRPEVHDAGGACDDDWTADPHDLGGLGAVIALKFTSDRTYRTGEGFTVRIRTTVPAGTDRDLVAWNSVAAHAVPTTGAPLLPTESPKVRITTGERVLAYGKEADRSTAHPGEGLIYTVLVRNVGTLTSAPTTVTDRLPEEVAFVSAEDGEYDPAAHTVTIEVPALEPNAEVRIPVVVEIDPGAEPGEIMNRALLENPAGYAPEIKLTPCPDDVGVCAFTTIAPLPLPPDGDGRLGMTGAVPWLLAGIAAVLLAAGAMVDPDRGSTLNGQARRMLEVG